MDRIEKSIFDIEMESMHNDMEKYCDITAELEEVKKKNKRLVAVNSELEHMVEVLRDRIDRLDMECHHQNTRREELVHTNELLETRCDNLELQLNEAMITHAETTHTIENLLFDQDLWASLDNDDEESQVGL